MRTTASVRARLSKRSETRVVTGYPLPGSGAAGPGAGRRALGLADRGRGDQRDTAREQRVQVDPRGLAGLQQRLPEAGDRVVDQGRVRRERAEQRLRERQLVLRVVRHAPSGRSAGRGCRCRRRTSARCRRRWRTPATNGAKSRMPFSRFAEFVCSVVRTPLSLSSVGPERRPVVRDEPAQLLGERDRAVEQVVDRGLAAAQLAQQQVAVLDERRDVAVPRREHLCGGAGVREQVGELGVPRGDRPREPGQPVERGADRPGRRRPASGRAW